jgi:hypothetical protein
MSVESNAARHVSLPCPQSMRVERAGLAPQGHHGPDRQARQTNSSTRQIAKTARS